MSRLRIQARLAARGVDVDLAVDEGRVLAVLGPNGVGKSTLLLLVAGLLRPDCGRICLGDVVLADTDAGTFIAPHRRGVALLSQQALLFPHLTVAANVAYGPRCVGLSRSAARAAADRWLAAVEATDLAERKPAQLSGGQAQRVALARALATEPRLLLLDEPLSALDVTAAPAMRRLLRTMLRARRRTAIIVTHDLLDALAVADDVAVIEDGRVVEHGPAREVLTTPRSDFAARIAGINLVAGRIVRPGTIRTAWGTEICGTGDLEPGTDAVAQCRPSAVSVFTTIPHGSPRNVVPVSIAEMEVHGETVRIRADKQPDGGTGLAADVTATAVADLELEPGATAYFVVKAQEVQLYPAGAVSG